MCVRVNPDRVAFSDECAAVEEAVAHARARRYTYIYIYVNLYV